ncbi:FG-GAP repeat protein [Photobacterium leiognathi]|uniref:FG-GAP repeat protein n=2 Tax=Photobacterium leiognathi TaxID=553611 RepID=UPI0006971E76|nr:FG-GAP repeat protein [Photobacterium leiognathi]
MLVSNIKIIVILSIALMLVGCRNDETTTDTTADTTADTTTDTTADTTTDTTADTTTDTTADTTADTTTDTTAEAAPLAFNLTTISPSMSDKETIFIWGASDNATEYSLCRKDVSRPMSCDVLATSKITNAIVNDIGVIKNLLSEYFVIAKNSYGEVASNERSLTPQDLTPLIQYIKASNPELGDNFGSSIALSSDGNTLAVGAPREDSDGAGVNSSEQANNNANDSGAVYLFRYSGTTWTQQAYIKASNPGSGDNFGISIALSSDGNTLVVGAHREDSDGSGVNSSEQANNNANDSGAVYLFRYSGTSWTQQVYIKASNSDAGDLFGASVALSSDGNTLAVGAVQESSNGTGVDSGAQANNDEDFSGAVYLFRYSGTTWTQQAYIKASNAEYFDYFGASVALSSDGNTLAVGALFESSDGAGVNSGAQANNNAYNSGAVYLFRYSGTTWAQQAYIKASNSDDEDIFGISVSLSSDGNTLAVGALNEDSDGAGVNSGAQANNNADSSGAVYLFRYSGAIWAQQAYIKASNPELDDNFGSKVVLSSDGNTLAVGASGEDSGGVGVNSGEQANNNVNNSGATYLFHYNETTWAQQAYIKAPQPDVFDKFGSSVALSSDGNTLAVGESGEQGNVNANNSGTVYFY